MCQREGVEVSKLELLRFAAIHSTNRTGMQTSRIVPVERSALCGLPSCFLSPLLPAFLPPLFLITLLCSPSSAMSTDQISVALYFSIFFPITFSFLLIPYHPFYQSDKWPDIDIGVAASENEFDAYIIKIDDAIINFDNYLPYAADLVVAVRARDQGPCTIILHDLN